MPVLSADQIIALSLASEAVSIGQAGSVQLTEMDMATRCDYEDAITALGLITDDGHVNQKAWARLFPSVLVAFSITGPDGDRPFASLDGVKQIASRFGSATLRKLFVQADQLSKVSGKALEDAEKN